MQEDGQAARCRPILRPRTKHDFSEPVMQQKKSPHVSLLKMKRRASGQ